MSVIAGSKLEIRLLGHPEIRRGEDAVVLPTRKALILLARLAVEGTQSRELLTALLWPDADEGRGRTNLRRTLAYVRDACGRDSEVVLATQDTLRLAPEATIDLALVLGALEKSTEIDRLKQAASAWRGDFLEGVRSEGEELDAWLASQRAAWQQRGAEVSSRLLKACSEAGDLAGGLAAAERWLARDPLSEPAHRERIRLHLARGDRTAALEAYRLCAEVLARDLGIAPSRETEALAEMARRGDEPAPASPQQPSPEVPMLGRELEHAALVHAFRRAAAGGPGMMLLLGEAGIGKSRLAADFSSWASAQGGQVRAVRAFPSGRRLAYAAVAEALSEALAAPSEGAPATEHQLFESASRFLAGLAARSPLVLVIDDLQWLDPDSLEVLLHAAGRLARARARFLLVAVARDDELAASSTLQDWVERAGRELPLSELTLGALSEADSRRLVEMWPLSVPGGAEQALAQAGGRPLLLVESLRFLAGGGDPDSIAPAARQAMHGRLRALDAASRRLAEAAAVLEKPTSAPVIAGVAGLDQTVAAEALDVLLRRHVLAGDGSYSYSHELLRRAAHAALSAESRRALHASAVRVLDVTAEASPAEVAHHAEMAGDLELAWRRRVEAGRQAMSLPAYRAAADQYRAALAIRPEPGPVWLELGRAQELAGHPDLAGATYRALADRARRSGEPAQEAAALVRLFELAGRDVGSPPEEELFEEALEAARDAGAADLEAEAELARAQVQAYSGELSAARASVEAIERRVAGLGRPDLAARCLNLSAFVSLAQGRWTDTVRLSRRAAAAYRALGESLMWIDSTGYEVSARVFLGDWRGALRRARRALAEAERLANPWQICNLSLGEAWALRDGGRLEEGQRSAERGVSAGEEAGFEPLRVLNAAVAGRCRRELGDLAGAMEIHQRILPSARGVGSVARAGVAEELCADHTAAGDWESAAAAAAEAEAGRGEMVMFSRLSLWTVARARLRAGAGFEMPELPEGERYRLVRLRTEAVIAEHSGDRKTAEEANRQALAIAEQLSLPVESRELLAELAAQDSSAISSAYRRR